jgi:hypothetical protein
MCRTDSGFVFGYGSTKAMHPDDFTAPASKWREAVARGEARAAPVSDARGEDVEWAA